MSQISEKYELKFWDFCIIFQNLKKSFVKIWVCLKYFPFYPCCLRVSILLKSSYRYHSYFIWVRSNPYPELRSQISSPWWEEGGTPSRCDIQGVCFFRARRCLVLYWLFSGLSQLHGAHLPPKVCQRTRLLGEGARSTQIQPRRPTSIIEETEGSALTSIQNKTA